MEEWDRVLRTHAQSIGLVTPLEQFYFLRHGETQHNLMNLVQGWYDAPLNDTGLTQAKAAGQALRGQGINRIICSPLSRARLTAETVSVALETSLGLPDPRLREKGFGIYENRPASDAAPTAWGKTDGDVETLADFAARTLAGLTDALSDPCSLPLVVAHGGTRRVLLHALGLEDSKALMRNALPLRLQRTNTGWSVTALEA